MRDANRLDDFYDRLKVVHKEKFSDLRFSQFATFLLSEEFNMSARLLTPINNKLTIKIMFFIFY